MGCSWNIYMDADHLHKYTYANLDKSDNVDEIDRGQFLLRRPKKKHFHICLIWSGFDLYLLN